MATAASRHETIADRLRDEILRGAYPPGVRLPAERDLALRHGAHRSSVREALRKLEQSGLIEIRHGDGATVQPLPQASLDVVRHLLVLDGSVNRPLLEQVLDVHEMLIVGAARLAIEHGTPAQLDRARELLACLAEPRTSDDDFLDTMESLLELIAEASSNLVLQMARGSLHPIFEDRFREARKRLRPTADEMAGLVGALDDAICSRDADRAESSLRSFVRAGRGRALDAIETLARPSGEPT